MIIIHYIKANMANKDKDFRRAVYRKLKAHYGEQLEDQLDKNLRYSTLKNIEYLKH
jgi:hypothetical protein